MKFAHILLAATTCVALSACAGMPPNPDEISKAPHIQFGQPIPQGSDFVLYFPAGTPLPVSTLIDGSLFEHSDQATMHVTLKHDVYVFRQFASFDGKNWQPSRKLIDIKLELQIPQKDGGNAGIVHVKVDQK